MLTLLEKLNDGMKVQESSSNLMSFLVQDMLDYSQIKAGKFRKQISAFNIRETIEKVMCIQRKKAEESGLKFFASYTNIF